jgi:hypothetical protein
MITFNVPRSVLVLAGAMVLLVVASIAFAVGASQGTRTAEPTATAGQRQPGPLWFGGPRLREVEQITGTITTIEGSQLSVATPAGQTRTIDAAGARITKNGQTIALSDLQTGNQVSARVSRQADGSYKAAAIQVLLSSVSGTVTAVGPSSITIEKADGTSQTLGLTASTSYREAGAKVSLSAVVVGARISAQGTVDSAGNFTATAITIITSSVTGTVASKTSSSMVVTTGAGKSVTVNVTADTKYSVPGMTGATLASVAVGDRVQATGVLEADDSITAITVQVARLRQFPTATTKV